MSHIVIVVVVRLHVIQPAVRLGEHRIEDRSVEEGNHQRMYTIPYTGDRVFPSTQSICYRIQLS